MVYINLDSVPLTLGNTLLWPGCALVGSLLSALGRAQVTTDWVHYGAPWGGNYV